MTVPPNNPLQYTNAIQASVPWVAYDFAPTSSNNAFSIPTLWIDTSTDIYYFLVAKPGGVAVWVPSASGISAPIETINTISPDGAGNFTIAAGAGITITPGVNQISVAASGGGTAVDSFTVPLGTSPVVPNGSGTIDLAAGANITATGGLNAITFNVSGTTNHAVQLGNAGGSLTSLSPSATAGIPVVSAGAAVDPVFGTTVVSGGGTGVTSFANTSALLASGTTSTNPLQNIASVATGQALISAGVSTLPAWSTFIPLPTSPSCLAYLSAGVSNVTGDGTVYHVAFDTTAAPGYNNASAFNTGTFNYVAQVTGRHHFDLTFEFTNLGAAHTSYNAQLVVVGTSAASYVMSVGNPFAIANPATNFGISLSTTVFMTQNDTAFLQLQVSGGAATVGLAGAAGGNPNGSMLAAYFVG